jgi:hypothetical protein
MVSRKRTRSEVDGAPDQRPEENGLLNRLRNCWEFANLMQYITIFGKVMKIDEDFGIDVSVIFPMLLHSSVYRQRRICTICPPSFLQKLIVGPPSLGRIWKLNASSLNHRKNSWRLDFVFLNGCRRIAVLRMWMVSPCPYVSSADRRP